MVTFDLQNWNSLVVYKSNKPNVIKCQSHCTDYEVALVTLISKIETNSVVYKSNEHQISSNIKARKSEVEVVTFDLELVFQILDDGLEGMLLHHLGRFKYFKIVFVLSFIFKYLRLSSCSPITFHSNGNGINLSLVSLFTFHQPSSKIIHFVLQISYHDSPKVMLDLLRLLFSKYIMIWKCQMWLFPVRWKITQK